MIFYIPLCNKYCNGTFEICLLMCATVFWGTYESFMHPILFLKYGCDINGDLNHVFINLSCRVSVT